MTQLLPGNSLGFLLTDLSRLYRHAFEKTVEEAGLGLTPGEIRALAHVARYNGSRQAFLAERMGVEPMTLSAYLDRLEAHGLILRTVDPTDRRAKVISPTPAAETMFEKVRPLAMKVYHDITRGLSDADVRTTEATLAAMRANLTNDFDLLAPPSPGTVPVKGKAA